MLHNLRVITVLTVILNLWSISISAQDLTEGIVGYWPLDGNGKDESGNGNDVELKNGAKWTDDGWVNGAVEVDGVDGHVVVDDKFELITDTVTVIARINGWKTVDWSGIVVGRSGTPFWMGVSAGNTLTYVWNDNSAQTWGWQGAPEIPQEKWALVAIAIAPDRATSYIFHEATGELDFGVNDIPHIDQAIMNVKFGWDECCGVRYFKGLIDEVMIYDRSLNADEIENLATFGVSVESAGKLAITWAALKGN